MSTTLSQKRTREAEEAAKAGDGAAGAEASAAAGGTPVPGDGEERPGDTPMVRKRNKSSATLPAATAVKCVNSSETSSTDSPLPVCRATLRETMQPRGPPGTATAAMTTTRRRRRTAGRTGRKATAATAARERTVRDFNVSHQRRLLACFLPQWRPQRIPRRVGHAASIAGAPAEAGEKPKRSKGVRLGESRLFTLVTAQRLKARRMSNHHHLPKRASPYCLPPVSYCMTPERRLKDP